MSPRSQVTLLRLFGIRVTVDLSWFLILFLMIVWLSGPFRQTLHSGDGAAYATTVATVLLFFGSLLVHEFGHALAARRFGIGVTGIRLFLFGGVTQMTREPDTPGEDLVVSGAGPAATLLFVGLCLILDLLLVGPHRLSHAVLLDADVSVTPVLLSLSWLLPMNVLILAFNLLPAFPLDGGRIARAIVWRLTGERARGIRFSARAGQVLAGVLGGLGVWLTLTAGALSGLYLLALAWMLGQSARATLAQAFFTQRIERIAVAELMDHEPVLIAGDLPLAVALDEYFVRYGWERFPVVDERRRPLGWISRAQAEQAVDAGQGERPTAAVLDPADAADLSVGEEDSLARLIGSETLQRQGVLMVVDGAGVVRGIVTAGSVSRALTTSVGLRTLRQ